MNNLLTPENIKSIGLAAVLILSGTNLYEVGQAISEIHEVHSELDGAMGRQKEILDAVKPSPSPK